MTEQVQPAESRRVAIVGFCNDSRDWVPYEDKGMQIWGLNRGYIFQLRADRWFDMHGEAITSNQNRRPGKHLDWLKQFRGPVYQHKPLPELPNAVAYPLAEVAQTVYSNIYRTDDKHVITSDVDAPYLTSSIAQEIALAIHEGAEEIHLYGIDLNTESEYAWQKPGVEFMLGVAAGKGIRVVLPTNCPLLKGGIYGRGHMSAEGERMSMQQLETRAKALLHEASELTKQLNELVGARRELQFVMDQLTPGLDHEQLDKRKQAMDQAIGEFNSKLLQNQGATKETAYWIHQTPAGQDPREAVEQYRQSHGAEGPVTELDHLQYIEQPKPNGNTIVWVESTGTPIVGITAYCINSPNGTTGG
jgi:hypothetical protein